jgi:Bacterial Ig-like domain
MAQKSILIGCIAGILSLFSISGCANQGAPGGGEIDRVPPQIIETVPKNGTTGYDKNYFDLTFSKWVDKRSVQESIFISPFIQKGIKYDWSGKTLRVYFKDTLKPNTTYTVTIGTDVKDLNNSNRMAEAATFAFSTGSKIDLNQISGKVYDQNPEGVMIYAYRKNKDHADPAIQKPDYISQIGKNGKFKLLGLGDGDYDLFAIRDKIKDFKYQKNEDEIGVMFKDLLFAENVKSLAGADFFISLEDTIEPKVTNVNMKDRNHIYVEFSKCVDSTRIKPSNFFFFDSTLNRRITPSYFFKGDAKPNQFILALSDTLDKKGEWVLISEKIPDLKSNLSKKEKTSFLLRNNHDTVACKIKSIAGTLPDGKIDAEEPVIDISFNDVINLETVKDKTALLEGKGNDVAGEIARIDDASFSFRPHGKLKPGTDYTLKVNLRKYYDLFGNKVDSLFQIKLTSSSDLDFSGASGSILSQDSSDYYVQLQTVPKSKTGYSQKVDKKKNFDFRKIIPGKYLLWSFRDTNKNGIYDPGTVKPFAYSEEFRYFPDTLNLRARWPVGEINIDFEKEKEGSEKLKVKN